MIGQPKNADVRTSPMFLCPRTPLFVKRTTDILMKFVDMDEEEEEKEAESLL